MSRDVAVLISDIHFNLKNRSLASTCLRAAFAESRNRHVPLIIAGDLHDSKALMRGECVNEILEIFAEFSDVESYLIIGNHDLINEKGKAHALNFLQSRTTIVDQCTLLSHLGLYLIAYHNDLEALERTLASIPDGSTLIMHQGLMGAHMGEYVVDKTSLPQERFANFRVISGHYHRAQNIRCGPPRKGAIGLWSFIGTPYSITAAEANDGPKGIQVLGEDGLLTQIPLGLRKHMTVEVDLEGLDIFIHTCEHPKPDDIFWLKVKGPASELDKLKKKDLGMALIGHQNFKFDRIYDEANASEVPPETVKPDALFDALIDASEETPVQKKTLKKLWRQTCA